MGIYAEQRGETYTLIVGAIEWQGEGKWTEIPLPERKEIARNLIATNLELQAAMEGQTENDKA